MLDNQPLPRSIPIEEFLPLVGRQFELDCDPNNVPVTLIEAVPGRHRAFDDRPPYTLVFTSTPDILLADGLYITKCGSAFGPDTIFISSMLPPPGATPGHYYYQAVFN